MQGCCCKLDIRQHRRNRDADNIDDRQGRLHDGFLTKIKWYTNTGTNTITIIGKGPAYATKSY